MRQRLPGTARTAAVLTVLACLAAALVAPSATAGTELDDGFESGDLGQWSSVTRVGDGTVDVVPAPVRTGAYAARLSSTGTGSAAHLRKVLSANAPDLLVELSVQVVREGASGANVPLLRLFGADGARLVSVYRQNAAGDRVYVQHSGAHHATSGRLAVGAWGRLTVRATGSTLAVALGGTEVHRSTTAALGAGTRTLQVGNDTRSQAFALAVDDVRATASPTAVPSPSPSPSPTSAPTPPASDPVLVGAGDIAMCGSTRTGDEATAAVLDGVPGTVVTLGDNVYDGTATLTDYRNCYEPSWGRHKARTKPALGNHEYDGGTAEGSFAYFGAALPNAPRGWYSYDLGAWHVVALNSNCAVPEVGGCGPGSPQEQWLLQDLAASSASCTLAYLHHPLYSSGDHGGTTTVRRLWEVLHQAGADVVLAGHDHHYERFAPQTPYGVVDAAHGLRSFVVGTGGAPLYPLGPALPATEARNGATLGVLALTLRPASYDWEFLPVAGSTFTDTGTGACHGRPGPAVPAPSASASPSPSASPAPSPLPSPSPSPVPPSPSTAACTDPTTRFCDGFETGDLSAWTTVLTASGGTAEAQTALRTSGSYGARLSATSLSGSRAYLRRSLGGSVGQVTVSADVRVVREGVAGANVPLLRLFGADGTRLVSVYRQNAAGSKVYVQHSGAHVATTGLLPVGSWAALRVTATAQGLLVVALDGREVLRTTTAALGAGVAQLQVGNDTSGQVFELAVDGVRVTSP